MRIAFDTNVLAYMAGVDKSLADSFKIDAARSLHDRLARRHQCVAPIQALGELYVVLTRYGIKRIEARATVVAFLEQFEALPNTTENFVEALDLASSHKLQVWDALILNAAAEAGCDLLLSEDMQDGFVWGGLTVVNPLADKPHPKLRRLLKG